MLLLGLHEQRKTLGGHMRKLSTITILTVTAAMLQAGTASATDKKFSFNMQVSGPAAACLPNAKGHVAIHPIGPVELMGVNVEGLPPNTDFDFFVIQVPTAPFGLAWYQGDIKTDAFGRGHQLFIGRFNIETFIVANGQASAPVVFNDPDFPDQPSNLGKEGPIQLYHLGLWFNSPNDARNAGCPAGKTPFNGEHNAGVQVLNTNNFPADQGPLRKVN
jgi:hypothetical protein